MSFINCLFAQNVARAASVPPLAGGAVSNIDSILELLNCTVAENEVIPTSPGDGYAVFSSSSDPDLSTITNCVFWGNLGGTESDQIFPLSGLPPVVSYSDVQGVWTGPGSSNIAGDPLFTSSFGLGSGSPCIDVGNNAVLVGDAFDIDQNGDPFEPTPGVDLKRRVVNAVVDMGAAEFDPAPCPADTNGDGCVDVDDLVGIVLNWGSGAPAADLNDDGNVDVDDLVAVILAWGSCCGSQPQTLVEEVEDAGLVYPDDWDLFMQNISDENYRCWMSHYLSGACKLPGRCNYKYCPGSDPFGQH